MKILVVLRSVSIGGAEKHALMLMLGLRRMGHDVFFAGPLHGWLGQQMLIAGIPCLDLPLRGTYDVVSLWRLSRYAKKINADIIHSHLTRSAFYAGWSSRITGIPNVATAHSDNAGKHFHHAKKIIAVAETVQRFLIKRGYSERRIVVVHNGIPDIADQQAQSQRDGTRNKLGIGINEPCLLMVARFVTAKGHDTLLRALSRIRHRPWKLLLAGDEKSDLGPQIRMLASQLNLNESIQFLGLRDDVPALLHAADILLAPSRREALSLSLLEASACSLPIIATGIGGNPEVITHDENGLLVPVDDEIILSNAIESLLRDPEKRTALGKAARVRFLDSFTEQAMIDKTIRIYRETLNQP